MDWYVRKIVETDIAYYFLNYFPCPRVHKKDNNYKRLIEIISNLNMGNKKFDIWTSKLNVELKKINQNEKMNFINEIDSIVSIFYGLNKSDISNIFETFHYGWNYKHDLAETLKNFGKKDKKVLYLK